MNVNFYASARNALQQKTFLASVIWVDFVCDLLEYMLINYSTFEYAQVQLMQQEDASPTSVIKQLKTASQITSLGYTYQMKLSLFLIK
jgi:hypothetical protein